MEITQRVTNGIRFAKGHERSAKVRKFVPQIPQNVPQKPNMRIPDKYRNPVLGNIKQVGISTLSAPEIFVIIAIVKLTFAAFIFCQVMRQYFCSYLSSRP